MNIIFLDVDGVLNSMPYIRTVRKKENEGTISDFHLQMLSKIYHACNAHIVLASTWRQLDDKTDKNCYPMYQYLVNSLAKYNMEIMSKTPIINMNRPLEIVKWLNNQTNEEKINFVILDDDFPKEAYKEYGIEEHLVETKYFCKTLSEGGLQQKHVDKAIKILKE